MTINTDKSKGIWRFIPRLRHIDEDEIRARLNYSASDINETKENQTTFEIRDEANRKWWSLFNEFEYRQKTEKNKNNGSWLKNLKWFDSNDTKAERKLIIKLDILLCFFSFAMYWVKYLDQTNLNNAYVSGMKEDLGMKGNDLVDTQSIYVVGAVVFQLPFMYIINNYPTTYLLPAMDIGWGIFTLLIFTAKNTAQLQVYRFFVGVFESAFYPTINYLFGCWYTPGEYARRGGMFYWGQMLGVLTAGLIQSAAFQNLHFVHGLEGWRWMFIIDAIITLPIGILGIYMLPGIPSKCYSLFLSDDEIFIARERLRKHKFVIDPDHSNASEKDNLKAFFDKNLWIDLLSKWQFWLFILLNVLGWNNSNASSGSYILWLKSLQTYSIPKVNQLSAITPALGIIWIWMTTSISDLFHTRFGAIAFSQGLNTLGNILLAVWFIPQGGIWFAFMLQYFGWAMIAVGFAWMSDSLKHNQQQRAIVTICMNMFGQASTAWTAVLVWKTSEAPRFLKGYTFAACCAFSQILVSIWILILYKRDERKKAFENGIILYNSANGDTRPEIPNSASSFKGDTVSEDDKNIASIDYKPVDDSVDNVKKQ